MNCQEALDIATHFMDVVLNHGQEIRQNPLAIDNHGLGLLKVLEIFQHLKKCDGLCSYYWSLLNGATMEIKEKIK